MPIYVYSCSRCGNEQQVRQKISDPKPDACLSCGSKDTLSKLLAPTSFKLEGGGWFSHGYVGGGAGRANGSES